tara:strand:- start:53 stop:361 length:309 start_codon:yes stop_codon:yes gene_type:complete
MNEFHFCSASEEENEGPNLWLSFDKEDWFLINLKSDETLEERVARLKEPDKYSGYMVFESRYFVDMYNVDHFDGPLEVAKTWLDNHGKPGPLLGSVRSLSEE